MSPRAALGLLLVALALLTPDSYALRVDVTPVHRLNPPPSPHESLEQRWTVAQSTPGDELQELRIHALCQVYISYAPQQDTNTEHALEATIKVTGSDFKLITTADVAALPAQGVQIRLQDSPQLDQIDGRVAVEITLHQPAKLRRLHANGAGDVVITEQVLVDQRVPGEISLESSGTGSLYLPVGLSLSADSVVITANGSSSVYLPTAATIKAPAVAFTQSGSGELFATSARFDAASNVSVSSIGAGEVCIDSTQFTTNVIIVDSTGSGDVYLGGHDGTYESSGKYFCDAARVHLSGAGSVDLGTIQCIDAGVELYGSGDAVVSSARSLAGHAFGAGKILYAGESPGDVLEVDPWAFIKQPIAHPVQHYKPRSCVMPTTPPRSLTHVDKGMSFVHHVFTPTHIGFVLLLVLCFGGVYVFENRRQQRDRHARNSERSPLLGQPDTAA